MQCHLWELQQEVHRGVERTKLSMLRRKVSERLVVGQKRYGNVDYFQRSKHDAYQRSCVTSTKMRSKQNTVV